MSKQQPQDQAAPLIETGWGRTLSWWFEDLDPESNTTA